MKCANLAFDKKRGVTFHFKSWLEYIIKITKVDVVQIYPNDAVDVNVIKEKDFFSRSEFTSFDLVHCHGFGQLFKVIIFRCLFLHFNKVVITIHAYRSSSRHSFIFKLFYTLLLLFCSKVHFLSQSSSDDFKRGNKLYAFLENKIIIYPLGVDISYVDLPELYQVEKSINEIRVMCFSQLRDAKGHMSILKGMLELPRDIVKRLKFDIYGDGPELFSINEFILKHDLNYIIQCHGEVERKYVPSIMKQADAVFAVSKMETLGHCYIEPAVIGIPIIGTRVGVGHDLIEDKLTGYSVEFGNVPTITNAIMSFISDYDNGINVGSNLQVKALQIYTWNNCALKTIEMYELSE